MFITLSKVLAWSPTFFDVESRTLRREGGMFDWMRWGTGSYQAKSADSDRAKGIPSTSLFEAIPGAKSFKEIMEEAEGTFYSSGNSPPTEGGSLAESTATSKSTTSTSKSTTVTNLVTKESRVKAKANALESQDSTETRDSTKKDSFTGQSTAGASLHDFLSDYLNSDRDDDGLKEALAGFPNATEVNGKQVDGVPQESFTATNATTDDSMNSTDTTNASDSATASNPEGLQKLKTQLTNIRKAREKVLEHKDEQKDKKTAEQKNEKTDEQQAKTKEEKTKTEEEKAKSDEQKAEEQEKAQALEQVKSLEAQKKALEAEAQAVEQAIAKAEKKAEKEATTDEEIEAVAAAKKTVDAQKTKLEGIKTKIADAEKKIVEANTKAGAAGVKKASIEEQKKAAVEVDQKAREEAEAKAKAAEARKKEKIKKQLADMFKKHGYEKVHLSAVLRQKSETEKATTQTKMSEFLNTRLEKAKEDFKILHDQKLSNILSNLQKKRQKLTDDITKEQTKVEKLRQEEEKEEEKLNTLKDEEGGLLSEEDERREATVAYNKKASDYEKGKIKQIREHHAKKTAEILGKLKTLNEKKQKEGLLQLDLQHAYDEHDFLSKAGYYLPDHDAEAEEEPGGEDGTKDREPAAEGTKDKDLESQLVKISEVSKEDKEKWDANQKARIQKLDAYSNLRKTGVEKELEKFLTMHDEEKAEGTFAAKTGQNVNGTSAAKAGEKAEVLATAKAGEKAEDTTAAKAGEKAKDTTAAKAEEKAEDTTAAKAGEKAEDTTAAKAGEKRGDTTVAKAEDEAVAKAGEKREDTTVAKAEVTATAKAGEQAGEYAKTEEKEKKKGVGASTSQTIKANVHAFAADTPNDKNGETKQGETKVEGVADHDTKDALTPDTLATALSSLDDKATTDAAKSTTDTAVAKIDTAEATKVDSLATKVDLLPKETEVVSNVDAAIGDIAANPSSITTPFEVDPATAHQPDEDFETSVDHALDAGAAANINSSNSFASGGEEATTVAVTGGDAGAKAEGVAGVEDAAGAAGIGGGSRSSDLVEPDLGLEGSADIRSSFIAGGTPTSKKTSKKPNEEPNDTKKPNEERSKTEEAINAERTPKAEKIQTGIVAPEHDFDANEAETNQDKTKSETKDHKTKSDDGDKAKPADDNAAPDKLAKDEAEVALDVNTDDKKALTPGKLSPKYDSLVSMQLAADVDELDRELGKDSKSKKTGDSETKKSDDKSKDSKAKKISAGTEKVSLLDTDSTSGADTDSTHGTEGRLPDIDGIEDPLNKIGEVVGGGASSNFLKENPILESSTIENDPLDSIEEYDDPLSNLSEGPKSLDSVTDSLKNLEMSFVEKGNAPQDQDDEIDVKV